MKGNWWLAPTVALAVLAVFLLLPPIEPLTPTGMKVGGIFIFTVILWVFVGIGFPSLMSIALFALLGVMTPNELFAASMGSWLVIFIMACLGLAEGLRATGLSRRLALWFMSRPFTAGRPWVLLAMLMLVTTLLGTIMSSTAVLIVVMAVVEPMLEVCGFKKGDRFAAVVMMGLAWAATAAFVATPIGHVSNVLLIEWVQRDTGYTISFVKWMLIGIPLSLLVYLLVVLILRFVVGGDASQFGAAARDYVLEERRKLGVMKLEEKMALGVFLGVLVAWVLPGIASNLLPQVSSYLQGLGYAVPAIVGAVLLCTIRVKNRPLVSFREWMTNVEWSAIMLVATIMVLGDALGKPETGLPQLLTGFFQPIADEAPFYLFLFIGVFWAGLQTNFMSNLVTAMLVYTVLMPAAISAGVGNLPALGYSLFAVTNYAFALPSATVVTAIVAGSGWVPVKFMVRYGFIAVIPIILLVTFVLYPLASLVFR